MTLLRSCRATTFALVLLSPALSFAQGTVDQEAETQFRLGMTAASHGRSEEARMRFQESYAIDPQPGTLHNLALAEAALPGYKVLALRHLREWLRGPKVKPAEKERAAKILAELLGETGHLTVEGVAPAGVVVDDGNLSASTEENGTFDVLAGHHVVAVTRDGVVQKRDVDVAAGTTSALRFEVAAAPVVATPPPAPVSAPPVTPPPEGKHDEAAPEGAHFWSTRKVLVVTLGGAAVAALGVGIGFGVAAQNKRSDVTSLQASCPTGCTALQDARDSQRTSAQVADVLYGASAVLGAGAIGVLTSLLVAPDGRAKDHAEVSPLFMSGGGGLAVSGRF